jgi:hypothetical protein
VEQQTHVLRTIIQPVKSSAPERLAQRVVLHGQRIEAGSAVFPAPLKPSPLAASDSRTTSAAATPLSAPVQRVVRHTAPAEIESGASVKSAAGSRVEDRAMSRVASSQSHLPGPMLDLTQLTDQVIRAIDQRIIAQRERLGRV